MQSRRQFLQGGLAATGALAMGPEFWAALARPARRGDGPYGPLGAPDVNGIRLPEGFRSRVVATGGLPVAGTLYVWHIFSDGASTFPTTDGGWILVSNSEVPTPVDLPFDPPIGNPGEGGASAIRFNREGRVVDAYRVLSGTSSNCAGGPTPWGTWLSGEEHEEGLIWECDPTGRGAAKARPALGVFTHEAACVDSRRGHVYLSEDDGEGGFYRFTPRRKGDLREGLLEVAHRRRRDRTVEWIRVPDPAAKRTPTRRQVARMTRFDRGEGIRYDSGHVYLATTGDSRIWSYDVRDERMKVIYDPAKLENPPLTDVDNITVARSGDLYVCEDTGSPDAIDIGIITPPPRREVARFLKLTGAQHGIPNVNEDVASEAAGVCFNPRGDRMYFASQRALVVGQIYEIRGPFR